MDELIERVKKYILRVQSVVQWIRELWITPTRPLSSWRTVLLTRVIRLILSIPEEVDHMRIQHTPPCCKDKNQGFLLEGINQKSHIPHDLQSGDTQADGWWPAIYKKEKVFMFLIPTTEVSDLVWGNEDHMNYSCAQDVNEKCIFYPFIVGTVLLGSIDLLWTTNSNISQVKQTQIFVTLFKTGLSSFWIFATQLTHRVIAMLYEYHIGEWLCCCFCWLFCKWFAT